MSETPESAHEGPLEPYREAVERFGATFEATLWQSREAQALRFEVMIEMVGVVSLEGCRILDIGCGRGDLAQCLHDHAIAFEGYTGLDAMPEMIEAARQRDLSQCEFEVANVLENLNVLQRYSPDFSFISGTLNTMDEATAKRVVKAAFDASAHGVVFNFLSNRHHPRFTKQPLGPARRFDAIGLIDWAMSHTPRVSFTQDYLDGHDATILMRHG